ncbi:MAG TPA: bifunctional adenosylcobinamide kinase/adenosylcobinamide-phosphate guanylyltransferase [Anaerolineaceae bacterium]|jgi:adenosylcobinamide kinase/adenosylcobinamide-phosphate guanylyltransferase
MGRLTFILGGARSGKSTQALKLAKAGGQPVTFIATATVGDDEMARRIAVHQSERPAGWVTREIPYSIPQALAAEPVGTEIVLLDCLTLLVTNLMLAGGGEEVDEAAVTARVVEEVAGITACARSGSADWIIVSNEVGLGLVPPYPLGRLYRDLLGRANQQLAAQADEVIWMVAGIPVPIQGYRDR